MRSLSNVLFDFIAGCGFAAAQATVIGGTASNLVPAYGVLCRTVLFPLVTTPTVTLATVSLLQ